jgi:hypothetical protein
MSDLSASEAMLLGQGGGFGGGLGGGGGLLAIIVLLLVFGGGFGANGFANAVGYQNLATQNDVQRGFDNQNSMANQREILNSVTNGTAQSVAATNQVFHDLVGYVGDKYNELDRDVLGVSAGIQQSIANQKECCCSTLRAIDGVNYNNALNTAAINANIAAQTQKVLDAMSQNTIQALRDKVQELQLAQQMTGVVKYPLASTYSSGGNPFCSGCGC